MHNIVKTLLTQLLLPHCVYDCHNYVHLLLLPFYGHVSGTGEPVPEETFTHSPIVIDHQSSLSASSIYYDP